MRKIVLALHISILLLAALLQTGTTHAQSGRLCFDAPGITSCIEGRFREYWEQNGGLAVFGYPLTDARHERSRDTGAVYFTQWFERNSFELHPENARPYDVLLGRLSDARLVQLNRFWMDEARASGPQPGCTWFEQTRHNVCDQAPNAGFKTYIETHGLRFDANPAVSAQESLALIGFPLTEVKVETNASGFTVFTQWFERARLEWYPNNPEPFKVQLGLLGNEVRNNVPELKPTCEQSVAPELRRHYEGTQTRRGVSYRQQLGCPNSVTRDLNGTPLTGATQIFQHGMMLWNSPMVNRGNILGDITVIFFEDPNRFMTYPDTWTEGQPDTVPVRAPGDLVAPRRGFAKVWLEEPGVRERLGWAVEPEKAERPVLQIFDYGWMLWMQNSDTVYTFFRDADEVTSLTRLR